MNTSLETILLIGGIDPSGGAGLTRDAIVASQMGSNFGLVATAIAVQDDQGGVRRIEPTPMDALLDQFDAATAMPVHAVKIGMLATAETIDALVPRLADLGVPLVLDPVMSASSGGSLLGEGGVQALEGLRHLATIITPNLKEAKELGAANPGDLRDRGWARVIVTGGDIAAAEAVDLFSGPEGDHELVGPRVPGPSPRGTGCTFATLIAVGLARGLDPLAAARLAKGATARAIRSATGGRLGSVDRDPVWAHAGHPFE
jgi:hydroxymethylpyrimidine/phosphomethylpyrimidine kinase